MKFTNARGKIQISNNIKLKNRYEILEENKEDKSENEYVTIEMNIINMNLKKMV